MAEALSKEPPAVAKDVGQQDETSHTNGTTTQAGQNDETKNGEHSGASKHERDWRERREEDKRKSGDHARRFQPKRHRQLTKEQKAQYKSNIKSDFSNIAESSDPDEIRKQVEFYFSDSNIFTDKFLLAQTQGSQNVPVPVKTIHNFKRMRHFQPYSAVVAALRDSKVLDIVTTESNEEAIKRKVPLPDSLDMNDPRINKQLYEDAALKRTVYAKGFGSEGPNTQFDIEAFFAPYGPTNAIRLRRQEPEKTFKGSVFVEFETEDGAKEFLALEKKPKWGGSGAEEKELLIMSKEDYIKSKQERNSRGKSFGSRKHGGKFNNRDGKGRSQRDRDAQNKDDDSGEKSQSAADADAKASSESTKRSLDNAEADAEQSEVKKAKIEAES